MKDKNLILQQNRPLSTSDSSSVIRDWEEQSRSAPNASSVRIWHKSKNGTPTSLELKQSSFQEMYRKEESRRYVNNFNDFYKISKIPFS